MAALAGPAGGGVHHHGVQWAAGLCVPSASDRADVRLCHVCDVVVICHSRYVAFFVCVDQGLHQVYSIRTRFGIREDRASLTCRRLVSGWRHP